MLAHRVAALFGSAAMTEPDVLSELTAREREVLDLMAQGISNVEIGRCLGLSPKPGSTDDRRSFGRVSVP